MARPRSHLRGLSSVPPAQDAAPGLPDLRALRGSSSDRDGIEGRTKIDLRQLGVPADAGTIYELALTHRSFAFEQAEPCEHNERLEFLGDAILGALVTDLVFNQFPALPEGDMARLRSSVVNTRALAELARTIGIGAYIRLGKGEEASGGSDKDSLLANTFEALIGAVYLDKGLGHLRDALWPLFAPRLAEAAQDRMRFDAKTALQELAVRDHGEFPAYRVGSSGPDHSKRFDARVYVGGELVGAGIGRSKKEAEQDAARAALEHLGVCSEPPKVLESDGLDTKEGRDARAS